MRKNNPLVIAYNLFFALTVSVVGAIIISWPLLLISVLLQKTYNLVNLSVSKVMSNYNQLMWYLIWPFDRKLRMNDFPTSTNAAEHFADVKKLFLMVIVVFIVCLVVWILAIKKHELTIFTLDRSWTIALLLLPLIVLPFALINFDSFFVLFHHMFFSNSNWLFDPETDPIINVLTEEFFAACFAVGGLIYELFFIKKLLHK
ncbi:TIGR01906 family membrane protein [Lactobacillus sp. LL6]|uniref:TIGR01906 family membrane protein n=1 Tax=Lactobacillus sp. LL6 TaxID=2596827 RepID=UPI0011861A0E|nr:TIGR01906 family membrane protein [Lactobacillus sp. LL6]TSO25957.1 TIGR01906 family membrane protein [Lactobacillus sp. LL6]